MANPREPFVPDTIYHVYNHGNGDDLIFREDENFRFFLGRFKVYITPVAEIYAYCLMPNHFHFLLRIKPEEELIEFMKEKYPAIGKERSAMSHQDFADLDHGSEARKKPAKSEIDFAGLVSNQFKNFLISYSKSFNKLYGRRGSLFLDNIQRIKVDDDDYFTTMIRYIHFNPVLHGFTDNLFQWNFSSIQAYFSGQRTLLNTDEVIEWFGGHRPFKQFHQSIQEEEFDDIKHLTIE